MNTHYNQPFLQNLSTQSVHMLSGTVIIGRHQDCNLVLKSERGASRKHARITVDNDAVVLMDLGSLNGTLVNGREINRAVQLSDGDILIFDEEEYRFTGSATNTLSASDNVTIIANKDEIGRPERIKPAIRIVETPPPAPPINTSSDDPNDETKAWESLTADIDQTNNGERHDTDRREVSGTPVQPATDQPPQAPEQSNQKPEAQVPQVQALQDPIAQKTPSQDIPAQDSPAQNAHTQDSPANDPQVQSPQPQDSLAQAEAPQAQESPQESQGQVIQSHVVPAQAPDQQSKPDVRIVREQQPPAGPDTFERNDNEQQRANERRANEQRANEHQVHDRQTPNQGQQNQVVQLHEQRQQANEQRQQIQAPPRPNANNNQEPYPPSFPVSSRPGGNARPAPAPARRGLPKHQAPSPSAIRRAKQKRLFIIIPIITLLAIIAIYLAYTAGFSAGSAGDSSGFS